MGFDLNSLEANPLFENVGIHDYGLPNGSPAFDLGIQEIPTTNIGVDAAVNPY